MAFDGTEGKQITIADASTMTKNYRTANPNGVLGHFMGKNIINSILNQPGCMGIRTYHGINSNGVRELVMVGVDVHENDMISGVIADRSTVCPPMCSTNNPLNS